MFFNGGTAGLTNAKVGDEIIVDTKFYADTQFGFCRYRFGKVVKTNKLYVSVEYPCALNGKKTTDTVEFTRRTGVRKGETYLGINASLVTDRAKADAIIADINEEQAMKVLRAKVFAAVNSQNITKLSKDDLNVFLAKLTA